MEQPRLTLITGGARSGKSSHAIALATAYAPEPRAFVATAEALDDEMRARIENHRVSRGSGFVTLEEPVDLCIALESLRNRTAVVVLDCLTLWISNLLDRGLDDERIGAEADRLTVTLRSVSFPTIVVTDEVGSGIVPVNPIARRFRDLLGWTNQKVARLSDRVILMAAGCPLTLK
jgi:adenosylcobinamide kinase/adenosylcobinamide-phosphate guanylyltransferase